MADPRNASAKLAEIRVFGGLLEAGAQVVPVPCTNDSTPDFIVDFGDGEVAVEVFSKHQDEVEDARQEAIHGRGPLPEGVERTELNAGNSTVTMTVSMLTPGGKPDALKPGDSVQANLISRICAAKGKELQFSAGKPNLLVLDFCHFGGRVLASMVDAVQAEPVESGHHGLSSGAFWYAMYGWKGAPIFEELSHKLVRMGHAGRFRLTGTRKTKLSAVLIVLPDVSLLLENPWADCSLPVQARFGLCRYPHFSVARSYAAWAGRDACIQAVENQTRLVEAFDAHGECSW